MAECVVCKNFFDESDLLFGDRGLTCAMCVVTGDEQAENQRGLWTMVIAPPLIAFSSLGALCLPLIGVGVALVMSCFALFGGIQAAQAGYRMSPQDERLPQHLRTPLLVSGIVTSVASVALTAFYFLLVVAVVAVFVT
ncbi:MAG: hypothetical protein ACJAZO_002075 [Myxococcota bacterium]|jgi:hypothetical protein